MKSAFGGLIKKTLSLIDCLYWLWLVFAAPFLLFPSPKRNLVMLVIPGTWLLHWVVARSEASTAKPESGWITQKDRTPIAVTPLNLSLLLLAVMVLVSLFTTYDLSYSLGKIAGVLFGFGVYFAVVRLCASGRGYWISLGIFAVCGLAIAGIGFLGTNWDPLIKFMQLTQIASRLPESLRGLQGAESGFNPNEVAGTLSWVIPIAVSLLTVCLVKFRKIASEFGKGKTLLITFFLLATSLFILAIFVLTQSRGAYLGLVITIPILIFVSLPRRLNWFFLAILAIFLIFSGIQLSAHWVDVNQWLTGNVQPANSALSFGSLQQRAAIWASAIKGIQDFPFTGMGLNTFRRLMQVLYPYAKGPFWIDIGHAHNEFLQAGVDLGIPGMIAFISLYFGAFWMLIRTWKTIFRLERGKLESNSKSSSQSEFGLFTNVSVVRAIILGLGGGLLAHLIYGLVDAVALGAKPGFVFWMLLALITGLFSLVDRNDADNLLARGCQS